MSFDLSQVLRNAEEIKANNENEGSGSNMKLLYTLDGDLKVKLLFNPASGLVTRKIDRHTVGGTKVPCMTMYGGSCPVCKQVETIQNTKGLDLWKLKKTTRGLAYAQYIESNYKWSKPEDQPRAGEIVLLMFPWTVYKDINKLIAEAGAQAESVVASNTGRIVKISRYKDGNQVKYSTSIDAWAQPFTSCEPQGDKSGDQVFEEMLTSMQSLNEKICPPAITDDVVTKCKEVSDTLYREYLQGSVDMYVPTPQPSYVPPTTAPADFNPQQPNFAPQQTNFAPQQPNNFAPQPPNTFAPQQSSQPNYPECFGQANSGNVDKNKCLICPFEVHCQKQ